MSDEENCKIEELIDEPKTETKVDPSKNASPHQNVSAALTKKRKRGKKAYEDEIKGKGNFFMFRVIFTKGFNLDTIIATLQATLKDTQTEIESGKRTCQQQQDRIKQLG